MKTHSLITRNILGKYTVNNDSLASCLLALTTIHGVENYRLFKKAYLEYLGHRDIYDWSDSQELLKAKALHSLVEDCSTIDVFAQIHRFKEFFDEEALEICLANPYFNYPEDTVEGLIEGIKQLQYWDNVPAVLVVKDTKNLKPFWTFIARVFYAMNWDIYSHSLQAFFNDFLDPFIKYSNQPTMSINIFNRVLDKE